VPSTVRPHRRDQSRAEDVPARCAGTRGPDAEPVPSSRRACGSFQRVSSTRGRVGFACARVDGRAAVLAAVFDVPGISFQEIASRVELTARSISKVASELAEFGSCARRRRPFRRMYSTDLLSTKREASWPGCRLRGGRSSVASWKKGLAPNSCDGKKQGCYVRFVRRDASLLGGSRGPYATAWKTRLSGHV